jgi:hypothetical protein
MSRVRIIAPNRLDEAALTASPALVAGLPVENLQDDSRARVARSVGLPSPQYIRGDWPAFRQINSFALWRHNLSGAATLRLKLYAGLGQTGDLLYDSGAIELGSIIPWGELVWGVDTWGAELFEDWPVASHVMWFDPVRPLSFELELDDPANPDGYIQASRIVMGSYFMPDVNFSRPFKFRWEDESTQERTDGGSLRTDEQESYRAFTFSLDWLNEAERAAFVEILRQMGKKKTMFLSMFPEDVGTKRRDFEALVKVVGAMPDSEGNLPLNYRSQLQLAEA